MSYVYVHPPSEDWIVDRFVSEWVTDNSDITTLDPNKADVIWLLADWCWSRFDLEFLKNKRVITSVHHIVPEKFGYQEKLDFALRDQITTVYHVYNQRTYDFIRPLTNKQIHFIPYWANQNIWKKTDDKSQLRQQYGIPDDPHVIVIGSFQRDTEGRDLISPKLEKGPDLLCDFIEKKSTQEKVFVVLAGWRRQYVMARLSSSSVAFKYFEKPSQSVVNDLYQTLDLYPVTARHEGGPQSLIECGLLQVPVVSRPVGIAEQVLPSCAISEEVLNATPAIPNVKNWMIPNGYEPFRKMIKSLRT